MMQYDMPNATGLQQEHVLARIASRIHIWRVMGTAP